MARPIWSGAISFGLLNIPVSLVSAKEGKDIHFSLLDKRDHSRIGYKQYNKATGREVGKKDIVKGFEYEPDHFVVVTDKDFEAANPKATRSIEIEDFVNLQDLDPLMFERPYYLLPGKNGERGYSLLRRVMERAKRVAIGKIVIHRKQRLVAILARGDFLVCEVLRYAHELVAAKDVEGMTEKAKEKEPSRRELDMAERLVADMTAKWNPAKYKDTYYDDLMKRIERKAKGGGVIESEGRPSKESEATQVLDLMPLLKKSLEAKVGRRKKASRRSGRKAEHGAS